jgi:DNA (cytosine-5)-methyltransferase 1
MQQVADLFCGAGGTSTGVLQAADELGLKVNLIAVNHWDLAIATHSENHPGMSHYNADLEDINPNEVVPSGKLRLLVASPECTHFSRARGGKPMSDQSRTSAKHIIHWAKALDIEDILIENVPDFVDWGPLDRETMRPIKARKGQYFHKFIRDLESLGYKVAWRILNAADYGDPTTRKRLFIIARKHQAIRFPEPTHHKDGGDMFGARPKWKPAREIIDWTIKGESIFKRKKPLAENTLRRIWAGLMKYGGKAFVIGQQSGATPRDVDQPVPTVAAAGAISMVEPYLVEYHNGKNSERRTRSIEDPLPTLDTSNRFGLCEPFIIPQFSSSAPVSVDKPLGVITTTSRGIGLVEPFIIPFFGERDGQEPRTHSIDNPLPSVTSHGAGALIEPFIIQMEQGGSLHDVDKPMPTITTADAFAVVDPFLVEYYGTGAVASIDDPMKTITARDHFALVQPMAFEQDGKKYLLDIRFRMLQPHELARAMSFPKSYKFKGTREQVVKQIGNAVPVNLAKQLAKALLKTPVANVN